MSPRKVQRCPGCGGTEFVPAVDNDGQSYMGCPRCVVSLKPQRAPSRGELEDLAATIREQRSKGGRLQLGHVPFHLTDAEADVLQVALHGSLAPRIASPWRPCCGKCRGERLIGSGRGWRCADCHETWDGSELGLLERQTAGVDELLAEYLLAHPKALPSETSVAALLDWNAARMRAAGVDAPGRSIALEAFARFDALLDLINRRYPGVETEGSQPLVAPPAPAPLERVDLDVHGAPLVRLRQTRFSRQQLDDAKERLDTVAGDGDFVHPFSAEQLAIFGYALGFITGAGDEASTS